MGFSRRIGVCQASTAEEWAVAEGLQLAWDLGITKLILESDSEMIVNLIMDDFCNTGSNLIVKIKEMICWDWQVDIHVIPQEVNCVANALTKSGISKSSMYDKCPINLKNWVVHESLGLNSHFV